MSKKLKILVTGSDSMMGRAICSKLEEKKYKVIKLNHKNCDLLYYDATLSYFLDVNPDCCIHCAGYNGNIQFNQKYPADIFYNTTQIGLNVLNACVKTKVKKIVSLISSCAYPDVGKEILTEKDFWNGEPNTTVDAHGFSKRTLMEYGRQLKKQYDINHIGMIVNTGYGPYDSYDIKKTKVIGGLIKKFIEAKKNNDDVICWGTGNPKREFIYCEDVGEHILKIVSMYDNSEYPINIGSGIDYSIKEVVEIIAEKINFKGKILWDTTKPDGQMKKLLDNSLMKQYFGNLKFTPLEEGIEKTVEWYESFYNSTNNKNL